MSLPLILPGLATLGLALTLGLCPAPNRPSRLTVGGLTMVAALAASLVAVMATIALLRWVLVPMSNTWMGWCPCGPTEPELGVTAGGLAALAGLVVVGTRTGLVWMRGRHVTRGVTGRRLKVLNTPKPVAYAAPGNPGCVVVSTGLLAALEPRERQVVFAHERAHLRQRHHRYLLIAGLSVAVVPFLRPLADRIRLATEYCADAEAVVAMGGDRRLVATAIAKAALTGSNFPAPATTLAPSLTPTLTSGPVSARIESLLGPEPPVRVARCRRVCTLALIAGALTAATIQLHLLGTATTQFCAG